MAAPFTVETRPNGYSVVVHPGSVAVIPVRKSPTVVQGRPMPERGEGESPLFHKDTVIILCQQHRVGPMADVIEIPAGTRDVEGEQPYFTAVREMDEEIGFKPSYIADLETMLPSPGYCSEFIQLYLAWGLMPTAADREFVPIEMTVRRALRMIMDGGITDAKTIVALMKWQLLSDSLICQKVE